MEIIITIIGSILIGFYIGTKIEESRWINNVKEYFPIKIKNKFYKIIKYNNLNEYGKK